MEHQLLLPTYLLFSRTSSYSLVLLHIGRFRARRHYCCIIGSLKLPSPLQTLSFFINSHSRYYCLHLSYSGHYCSSPFPIPGIIALHLSLFRALLLFTIPIPDTIVFIIHYPSTIVSLFFHSGHYCPYHSIQGSIALRHISGSTIAPVIFSFWTLSSYYLLTWALSSYYLSESRHYRLITTLSRHYCHVEFSNRYYHPITTSGAVSLYRPIVFDSDATCLIF